MAEDKSSNPIRLRTIGIGIGILLVLALIIAAISIPRHIERVEETAYEKGAYDHAYSLLEDEWADSRTILIHASLTASACEEFSDATEFCEILQSERTRLQEREIEPRLGDSSPGEYRIGSLQADSQVRQLDASDQRLTRYIGYIEDSSTDDDVWESIDLTAGLVQDALEALTDAEQAMADGSADSSLTEAKQNLEAILSQYQAAELPTGWDADDYRGAHDELNSAIDDLRSAL